MNKATEIDTQIAHEIADPLVLRFAGQLVEQLGAQLYPKVTSAVAELVSNAWDADASNVWVTIPFEEAWNEQAVIEVLDDGNGMTREQAQTRYLVVGLNRRKAYGLTSEGGRALHGRKGIGKLAAFGTAGLLECTTLREGEQTAFAIDYDALRQKEPTEDFVVNEAVEVEPLLNPETGKKLLHGTRVRLTKLKAKRRSGEAAFRRSMARRFALEGDRMRVFINREQLGRFEYAVEIRFPRDGVPAVGGLTVGDDGWARELIDFSSVMRPEEVVEISAESGDVPTPVNPEAQVPAEAGSEVEQGDEQDETPLEQFREVKWWIGFTSRPIPEEETRGISILARGKLAQRPFMFETAQGMTGQLGQEYLVGEVKADWLDHGSDAKDDLIQSNRDQLQFDNAELEPLLDWGRERLRWALSQRNLMRRDTRTGPEALGKPVEKVLERAPRHSRERLRTLAGRVAEFTQGDAGDVAKAVDAIVAASEARTTQRAAEELRLDGDPDSSDTWKLLSVAEGAALDSRAALLETRAEVLAQFLSAIAKPPVVELHQMIAENGWVISPALERHPYEVIGSDETKATISYKALRPLVESFVIECWAVGAEPETTAASETNRTIAIASRWEVPGDDRFTWHEVLEWSRDAHAALATSSS